MVQSHASVITQQDLQKLGPGRLLSDGGFGSVRQLVLKGKKVVVKELLDCKALKPLLREAGIMLELDGAGGVPRLVAVCQKPPAMVQEFVGTCYAEYLMKCCVGDVLKSFISICKRLQEIHAKDIVHNDLKMDNITVSGSVSEADFHVIDLGWACHSGQVPMEIMFPRPDDNDDEDYYDVDADEIPPWMAPEVMKARPVWPSGDVYSFGFLVEQVVEDCRQTFLTEALRVISEACMEKDPRFRPCLALVVEKM